MASALFEALEKGPEDWLAIDIRVLPGITAMLAAAARLGAPLGHDFCAINLSDNLKPWSLIEKRLRLVDQPAAPLPLPHTTVTLARGPFDVAGDIALLRDHGTKLIIAKNAGGTGAEAKLIAARELGLRVLMIQRPAVPPRTTFARLDDILAWLDHTTDRGV